MAKGKGKPSYSLDEIDKMMRTAYDEVKAELNRVEAELADLKATRDGLADRVRQLELGLGLSSTQATAAPEKAVSAPSAAPESKPRTPKTSSRSQKKRRGKKTGRKRRRRGALWHDVQAVMNGRGNMQASKVIQSLIKSHGYDDSESVRTRVYNSLGRWAREGKLKKSGRGVYSL